MGGGGGGERYTGLCTFNLALTDPSCVAGQQRNVILLGRKKNPLPFVTFPCSSSFWLPFSYVILGAFFFLLFFLLLLFLVHLMGVEGFDRQHLFTF